MYSYFHKIQYYETDKMGIVHHSNYFRWMEEARLEWMQSIGFGYCALENAGIVSPVIRISCSYHHAFTFGETANIHLFLEGYSGVKITIGYRFFDASGKDLRAEGQSQHCFMGAKGLPLILRHALPALDTALSSLLNTDTSRPPQM